MLTDLETISPLLGQYHWVETLELEVFEGKMPC